MEITKNETFKDTSDGIIKGTVRDFGDVGLKKDELGNVRIRGVSKPLMTEGNAIAVTEQMERTRRAAAYAVSQSGAALRLY